MLIRRRRRSRNLSSTNPTYDSSPQHPYNGAGDYNNNNTSSGQGANSSYYGNQTETQQTGGYQGSSSIGQQHYDAPTGPPPMEGQEAPPYDVYAPAAPAMPAATYQNGVNKIK